MTESENYSNEEKLLKLVEELQSENEQLRNEQQAIAPLIQAIRQQEKLLTEQRGRIESLDSENERLMTLAENARQLESENSSLKEKLENESLKSNSLSKRFEQLEQEIQGSAGKFQQMMDELPKQEDIKAFSAAIHGANNEVENTHIFNFVNTAVVVVFVLLVAFTGWQVYQTRGDVQNTHSAVVRGIYDKEGWSVFNGTQSDNDHQRIKEQQQKQQYNVQ